MNPAIGWLPNSCFQDGRAIDLVDDLLAAWSAKWFVQRRYELLHPWRPARAMAAAVLREAGPWSISGDRNAGLQIARAMLGETERADLTAADQRLLCQLANEALDDLAERLKAASRSVGDPAALAEEPWILDVAIAGRPCFGLSLGRGALSVLVRRTYSPERKAAALENLPGSLDDLAISVAGRLGSASLSVEQIVNLEPGDILLLDQQADDPISLLVANRESPLRCVIAEASEKQTLILHETS